MNPYKRMGTSLGSIDGSGRQKPPECIDEIISLGGIDGSGRQKPPGCIDGTKQNTALGSQKGANCVY